jgi:hypothetical protein
MRLISPKKGVGFRRADFESSPAFNTTPLSVSKDFN